MRKLGISILVLLIVIVGAAALVPKLINVNRYHDRVQSELQNQVGRPVQLGQMNLSLLPPSFRVQNAVIGEDPNFSSGTGQPFATAQQLQINIKLLRLLGGKVNVSSLRLLNPKVELIRNQQGEWNFSSIGKGGQQQEAKQQGEPSAPAKPSPSVQGNQTAESNQGGQPKKFELGRLRIDDGTLAITDQQKHQSRAVYDHIDLTLANFAPDKQFDVTLAAHLPGSGKQLARLDGKGGPINSKTMLDTPFDGKVKLSQVSLSGLQKFLNSEALAGTDAVISGDATVKNESGKLASSGSLTLNDAVVRGVAIGYPVSLDYDAHDDLTNDVIQVSKGNLKLGNTPMSVSGSINTRANPSLANLQVRAQDVSIAEIGRLAAAFGVALNPGMQIAGRFNADVHAQGAASSPALNGTISARDVTVSGKGVPAPVQVPAIQIALSPSQIQSNSFTATSGKTSVQAQFTAQQYTTASPVVDGTVKTANANIAELINIAQAAGVTAADGMTGSGVLSLDVHAKGPVKNASAMQFSGNGAIQGASVKNAQMTQPLQVRNANVRFTENSMMIDGLDAQAASTHATGTMNLRNFAAPQVQFALNADKVNVVELQKMFGQQQNPATPTRTASGGFEQLKQLVRITLIPRVQAQQRAAAPAPSILNRMTGGGDLTVGNILYNQLELQNVKTRVALNNGIINLNPLTAMLYGGQVGGTVAMDTRSANPVFNVKMKTQNVDSNRLLAAVSPAKDVLYGALASTINASFATPPGEANIMRTLNGRISLNLTNGKLTNVNMLQQLGNIGKFQGLTNTANNFTEIKQLSGDFDVRNGVASTDNLKALTDAGTVAANGSTNLVDQSLNMRMTAVLSKSQSQQVGGSNIGGFAQTALANNNGELVLPVLVTGTFQKMQFSPDVQALAEMKLKNLLPSFSNPGQLNSGILGALGGKGNGAQGAVGGILGALAGKSGENQQPANQQTPPAQASPQTDNGLEGIIGGILGGDKKKQK